MTHTVCHKTAQMPLFRRRRLLHLQHHHHAVRHHIRPLAQFAKKRFQHTFVRPFVFGAARTLQLIANSLNFVAFAQMTFGTDSQLVQQTTKQPGDISLYGCITNILNDALNQGTFDLNAKTVMDTFVDSNIIQPTKLPFYSIISISFSFHFILLTLPLCSQLQVGNRQFHHT